jgi:hypothetical protein
MEEQEEKTSQRTESLKSPKMKERKLKILKLKFWLPQEIGKMLQIYPIYCSLILKNAKVFCT